MTQRICASCGVPGDPTQPFCSSCGARHETSVPAGAPGPAPVPERRGRGLWVAVLVVLVLVVGGGLVAWAVTGDDEDPGRTPSETAPGDSGSSDAANGSPPSSASASPRAVGTAPSGARCWDGTSAPDVDSCPYPSGRQGLEWVFPSMAKQTCSEVTAAQESPRVQLWACSATLADGTPVRLAYSQWGSIRKGYTHFTDALGEPTEVPNKFGELALYRWDGPVGGEFERVVLDARQPFSVEAVVPEDGLGTVAFDELVVVRPGTQFRGMPAA